MREVRLFIPCIPLPQGRPRARVVHPKGGGTSFVQIYELAESRDYKQKVRSIAVMALKDHPLKFLFPLDCPLSISMTYYLEKPKSVNRAYPIVKPDLDNYNKASIDALTGVIWRDDSIIIAMEDMKKLYSPPGQSLGIVLVVRPYGAEEFPGTQESMTFAKKGVK